jgi:hypothetical protein
MVKRIGSKYSQRKAGALIRRSLRAIGDDCANHKIRYALLFFLHGWLIGLLLTQPYMTALTAIIAVVELVLIFATVRMMGNAVRHPGRVVHEWALEQSQKDTISKLKGNTHEELEQLLQYHLAQGNIEEADKISQRMLHMVDGLPLDPLPTPAITPVEIAKKTDDGVVLKVATGLPSWMAEGDVTESTTACREEEEKPEPAPETSTLPDWMKS